MKRLLFIALLLKAVSSSGQVDTILVNRTKTVYVMFETDVALVDLGTKGDFAFQAQQNMVMLKALKENGGETSLMVKTKTNVFVWIIGFAPEPPRLLIDTRVQPSEVVSVPEKNTSTTSPVFANNSTSEKSAETPTQKKEDKVVSSTETKIIGQKERYMDMTVPPTVLKRKSVGNRDVEVKDELMEKKLFWILDQKTKYKDVAEISNGIYFSLQNIFVDQSHIYIKVSLFNTSSIAFDLDLMYFERNQGKTFKKREANSQVELPYMFKESVFTIQPSSEEELVYVLNLYAFEEKDKLMVKVNERGGLRSLEFFIPAKEIVNAKPL